MEDVQKDNAGDDGRVLKQDDAPLQGPEVPPESITTTSAEPGHEVQVDKNNEN